jgi:ribonucleoside-diphosphate reductase alpha chain
MQGYRWLNDLSLQFLQKDYLLPNQTVDERVNIICEQAEKELNKPGFAARFKENIQKGWYSLSTPIWTNYGTTRGLPISCYGSYISDDMSSILLTQAEVGMMSKLGGGTSAYFGKLRPRGAAIRDNGTSSGSVHFMQLFDSIVNIVSQGKTRRGNFAAYLPLDHPDIEEFLAIRSEGHPIQDLSYGVCVSDQFMNEMIGGDQSKRSIWAKVLESRMNTGFPYIFFTDNVNKGTVDVYKENGLKIHCANLCNEINLHSNEEESFVCDL